MYPLLSRRAHGTLDYIFVLMVLIAPWLMGYADDSTPTRLSFLVAGLVLSASLLTRYELGVMRVVPMRAHLMTDFALGVFALAAPWMFGFADDGTARITFLAIGVISIAASLLTTTAEMPGGAVHPASAAKSI